MSVRTVRFLGIVVLLTRMISPLTARASEEEEAFFETNIRPVLASSCIECHGPSKASGGLRLDSPEALLKGGDSGAVLEPGNAASSLLVRAIRRDPASEVSMPPDEPLPSRAVQDIARWIEAGAKWPDSATEPIVSERRHWAFEPLKPADVPDDPTGWATQPIDRFIALARRDSGLSPAPQADKPSLLRRAYADLVGLPPSPAQVEAFLADDSPRAFEMVVDELLGSPRYGERWARHWLDLVRFADTAGDNADYPIPQAYLYRDYVIDAFNADLPYDRFLHEQLAGDILAKNAPETDYARLVIATGFIAQAKRIGTRELEDMHLIIEDTLSTLGAAVMGLSIRCARCHDHKFEPLTMEDYYALYGFFASTQYPFAGAEEVRKQTKFAPLIPLSQVEILLASRETEIADLKSRIASLEMHSDVGKRITVLEKTQMRLEQELNEAACDGREELLNQLKQVQQELAVSRQQLEEQIKVPRGKLASLEAQDPLASVATAYAVGELNPTDVAIQPNGNPSSQSSTTVPRGVPKVLDDSPLDIPADASGRLQLAHWLTSKASFLTARVMVNRIWQHHFGKPIVATPSDFGFRGSPPTHPKLLDWLANEFIASGWSIKSLHRRIMLSKTYQLSTQTDLHHAELDPGNIWYWRYDRRRLDAESLRDKLLMLGGSLDLNRPGPHPFPEPSTWRFTAHHQFNDVCYDSDHRSIYLMVQRLHAHPYLSLFNGADPSLTTPNRDKSTVPLQALYLLNNEFVHRQATKFADRLLADSSDSATRITTSYLQVYARRPSPQELSKSLNFIERYMESLEAGGVARDRRDLESWSAWARTLFASNEFFYVD